MEELWNTISRDKDKIRYHQAESYSPYSEYAANGIQQTSDGLTHITMNSFYRYDRIMQPLFGNQNISEKHREWLFDIYMHYLTALTYKSGVTYQEYEIRQRWSAIERGEYGEQIRSIFIQMSNSQKYYIAHSLWQLQRNGASVSIFTEILVAIMQTGIIYKNELDEKELYLYMNRKDNHADEEMINMIKELFLPLDYRVRIFWGNHFAVLGEAQTTLIDEIEIL